MDLFEKFNTRGLFVTGTDTGVGKTVVSTALIREQCSKGIRCAGFKPIASGAIPQKPGWYQEDVDAMQRASTLKIPNNDINPFCFEPPIAPLIAADQVGVSMSVKHLVEHCNTQLMATVDRVVVEGAGGFIQPLNKNETLAELAVSLEFPVVCVVGIRLGCINHSLLTQESILSRGLTFAGWYANCIDPNTLCLDEQIELLSSHLSAPCLGRIAHDEHHNL